MKRTTAESDSRATDKNICYLLARQRSGTNVLRSCLGTHEDIDPIPEILNDKPPHSFEGITNFEEYIQDRNPLGGIFFPLYKQLLIENSDRFIESDEAFDFLMSMIVEYSPKTRYLVDVKYNSLRNVHDTWPALQTIPPLLVSLKSRKQGVFHLIRRNYLANLCSIRVSSNTQVYTLSARKDNEYAAPTVQLNEAQIVQQLEHLQAEVELVRDYFSDYDRYFECYYEDLFDEESNFDSDTLENIAEFLGVENNFDVKPRLKKVGKTQLSDTIENFEEVQRVLKDSAFAYCLKG